MALKIINLKKFCNNEDAHNEKEILNSLESELRASVNIAADSSSLLQILEYFIENNYCFLVMEYCDENLQMLFNSNKKNKIKISRIV
jgi:serine/threonine protein kinase